MTYFSTFAIHTQQNYCRSKSVIRRWPWSSFNGTDHFNISSNHTLFFAYSYILLRTAVSTYYGLNPFDNAQKPWFRKRFAEVAKLWLIDKLHSLWYILICRIWTVIVNEKKAEGLSPYLITCNKIYLNSLRFSICKLRVATMYVKKVLYRGVVL